MEKEEATIMEMEEATMMDGETTYDAMTQWL